MVKDYKVKIYAFTFKNNHFHLMLEAPMANINEAMCWVMKISTLEVQKRLLF
ncbi:transposase [Halobacteriovorax sp. RZ-2]|uniref:transposase n=1 Tax=unclassified Halobacteriovorax TaxID=2639665 RepID=UPI003719BE95